MQSETHFTAQQASASLKHHFAFTDITQFPIWLYAELVLSSDFQTSSWLGYLMVKCQFGSRIGKEQPF